jgi:hypothetical protein
MPPTQSRSRRDLFHHQVGERAGAARYKVVRYRTDSIGPNCLDGARTIPYHSAPSTKAHPAKAGAAKPRILASSATLQGTPA